MACRGTRCRALCPWQASAAPNRAIISSSCDGQALLQPHWGTGSVLLGWMCTRECSHACQSGTSSQSLRNFLPGEA